MRNSSRLREEKYPLRYKWPIVTMDFDEYTFLSKDTKYSEGPPDHIRALYFAGVIWLRKKSFRSIFHELIHHVFRSIGNHCGETRLFFDFVNEVFENVSGFVNYGIWRRYFYYGVEDVIESWNDFLDFKLCRDPK